MLPKLFYDRLKDIPIAAIRSLFGAGLEVTVNLKDLGIVGFLTMRRKNLVQAAEDSIFPVTQGAVTIKGNNLEAAEVQHIGMTNSRLGGHASYAITQ